MAELPNGHHHKGGHQHKEDPSGRRAIASQPEKDVGVAKIIILHKRNGGDSALYGFAGVNDHFYTILAFGRHIFVDHGIGTEPQHQTYHEAQDGLTYQLIDGTDAILALVHLGVIIDETEHS